MYRNDIASRRLSHAGVESEVDASPMDEEVLGVGIGCVLFVEVVGVVGVVLWGVVTQGKQFRGSAVTDMMRGWVMGMIGESWIEGLVEGAGILYRGNS